MTKAAFVLSTETHVSSSEVRSIVGGIQCDGDEFWAAGDKNNFVHIFNYSPDKKKFIRKVSFQAHNGWISSISYMKKCEQFPDGAIVTGSHDHSVKVWDLRSLFGNSSEKEPSLTYFHDKEVCFVSACENGKIISTGWDSTCRISNGTESYVLKHEQYAVWSAAEIPSGYVTCGADKTLRVWSKSGELKFKLDNAHRDVLRGSLYIKSRNIFVTSSNDGTIGEWEVSGYNLKRVGTISVSDQYLYSLGLLDENTYIVSSEDRCTYVASSLLQKVIDVLPLPDIAWCASAMTNGDIVCSTADGVVRSFTQNLERRCDAETEQNYIAKLGALTFSNPEFQQINPLDLPDISTLTPENAAPGGGTLVRNGKEMVICTWSNGYNRWIQIGTVVTATDGQQKNKVADAEGNVWDYCFQIELEDGRSYPLYLNHDTNEYTAAYKFMNDHNLDTQLYLAQIVEFIQKNRRKTTLSTSTKPSIFPMKTPNFYSDINTGPVINKLKTLNNNNNPHLTDEQFYVLEQPLTPQLFDILEQVVLNWPYDQSWPILDILRARITDSTARQSIPSDRLCNLVNHVAKATDPSTPEFLILMIMRVIANMFQNYSVEAMTRINIINIFNNYIARFPSLMPRTQVAYATAVLNYSTFLQGNPSGAEQLINVIIEMFGSLLDEGALHRLLYAAGNAISFSSEAKNQLQLHLEVIELIQSRQLPPDIQTPLSALIDMIA